MDFVLIKVTGSDEARMATYDPTETLNKTKRITKVVDGIDPPSSPPDGAFEPQTTRIRWTALRIVMGIKSSRSTTDMDNTIANLTLEAASSTSPRTLSAQISHAAHCSCLCMLHLEHAQLSGKSRAFQEAAYWNDLAVTKGGEVCAADNIPSWLREALLVDHRLNSWIQLRLFRKDKVVAQLCVHGMETVKRSLQSDELSEELELFIEATRVVTNHYFDQFNIESARPDGSRNACNIFKSMISSG
jgi:hypothetical protein